MTTQTRDRLNHPYPAFRYGETYVIPYTDTHGVMAVGISELASLVMLWATSDCHVAIGANPIATVNDKPLTGRLDTPAVMRAGEKVSVVRLESSGTLYVTELL